MYRGGMAEGAVPLVPTRKNAWLVWLVPLGCFALAPPLGAAFGTTAFRAAPTAALNVGICLAVASVYGMLKELAGFTGRPGPVFWHWVIPFYGLYWAATVVRAEVVWAKAKAGQPAPRAAWIYAVALPYALAADLNDLVGLPKLAG